VGNDRSDLLITYAINASTLLQQT